jgi:hypothetical protein
MLQSKNNKNEAWLRKVKCSVCTRDNRLGESGNLYKRNLDSGINIEDKKMRMTLYRITLYRWQKAFPALKRRGG